MPSSFGFMELCGPSIPESINKLVEENIHFRVTMNISAPLITMLTDDLLKKRYLKYLVERLWLAHKEIRRTKVR